MRFSGVFLSLSLSVGLFSSPHSFAQIPIQQFRLQYDRNIAKDPTDTIPNGWRKGGQGNISFNQAALSNWSAGGDKSSVSLSTFLNLFAFYKNGKRSWDNSMDMAYGLVKTTSQGTHKSDDRIDLLSKYGYDIGKKYYFTGLFNFRTQFSNGYAYPDANTKVLTSAFAAPAYLLFSMGIDYKVSERFSAFLSPFTVRWVLVSNDSLARAAAFGVDSGRHSRLEFGSFASVRYENALSSNMTYKTRVDLFSNYLRRPEDINIYWTNIVTIKALGLVAVNISLDMIYDNDIRSVKDDGKAGGPALQLKEVMGVGLAYKFDNRKKRVTKLEYIIPE